MGSRAFLDFGLAYTFPLFFFLFFFEEQNFDGHEKKTNVLSFGVNLGYPHVTFVFSYIQHKSNSNGFD